MNTLDYSLAGEPLGDRGGTGDLLMGLLRGDVALEGEMRPSLT